MDFEHGGRIAKMNMEFSKMLEAIDSAELSKDKAYVEIPTINEAYNTDTLNSQSYGNYYADVIQKSRVIKEARAGEHHTKGIPLGRLDSSKIANAELKIQIDKQLESLYNTKKAERRSKIVYNMASVCEANQDAITLSYSTIPVERSLTVKKSFKETLFSDVDFSKQWGAIKKFCSIQIKI